jgi:hypothetical protein
VELLNVDDVWCTREIHVFWGRATLKQINTLTEGGGAVKMIFYSNFLHVSRRMISIVLNDK